MGQRACPCNLASEVVLELGLGYPIGKQGEYLGSASGPPRRIDFDPVLPGSTWHEGADRSDRGYGWTLRRRASQRRGGPGPLCPEAFLRGLCELRRPLAARYPQSSRHPRPCIGGSLG